MVYKRVYSLSHLRLLAVSLSLSPPDLRDERLLHGVNVRRLMVQQNLTLEGLSEASGLDRRTLRSILKGSTRPHARTLHKLAEGLGVAPDELFQDPFLAGAAAFDRATNPVVAEVIDKHPGLFVDWTAADYEELYSRMGVGGELTEEGTLDAAQTMNERRELLSQASVILETREGELLRDLITTLYRRVTTFERR